MNAQLAKPLAPMIARQLRHAHRMIDPALEEMSVALVNDARMSELHDRYMGIDSPTDVLTFELDHDASGRVTSGEVVVCVPEAKRQSKARGTRPQDEMLLYALHGMLHLCGFDDKSDAGFKRMHATEDRILTKLGVGPVFATAAAGKRSSDRPPNRSSKRGSKTT